MAANTPKRLSGLSATLLSEAVCVVAVLFIAGYCAHRGLRDWQPSPPVQNLARASITWAAGHGCHDFADAGMEEALAFIEGRVDAFEGEFPQPPQLKKIALTRLQKTHLYLIHALGVSWRLFGIRWSVAKHLVLAILCVNALFLYGFCRQNLGRFLSVLVVICFVASLDIYGYLDLRDASKAPFYSGAFFLLALLLKQPASPRRYLATVLSFAVLIGIGLGFRRDMLVLALFVLPVLMFCPGASLRLRHRVTAVFIYAVILVALGHPVGAFSFHERSEDSIRIICGFAQESEYQLPLEQASYIKEPSTMNDHYGMIVSQAAAQTAATMPDRHYENTLNTPDATAVFADAYLKTLLTVFPFDVTTRAFSAVVHIVQGRMLPLPEPLKQAAAWTPVLLLALLFGVASKTPWRATLMLYALLVFCGYTSLQFQIRHVFHLFFVPFWCWAATLHALWSSVRRFQWPSVRQCLSAWGAGFLWAITMASLAALPMFGLYRFQTRNVAAMLHAYETAERALITPEISRWGDDLLLAVDITDCTAAASPFAKDTLVHKTFMLEVACAGEPVTLGLSYYGGANLSRPMNANVQNLAEGALIRIYVPVYERYAFETPELFNGFVVSPTLKPNIRQIYQIDNTGLLPVSLTASGDNDRFVMHQKIGRPEHVSQKIFYDSYAALRDEDYLTAEKLKIQPLMNHANDADYHIEALRLRPRSIGHHLALFRLNLIDAQPETTVNAFRPLVETFPDNCAVLLQAFILCADETAAHPLLLWESLDGLYPGTPAIKDLFDYALFQTLICPHRHEEAREISAKHPPEVVAFAERLMHAPAIDFAHHRAMGDALADLGVLFIKTGRQDAGETLLDRILLQSDWHGATVVSAYRRLARHYAEKSKFTLAARYYRRAIEAGADDTGLYVDLAETLERAGYSRDACEMYCIAVERAPELGHVAQRVDALHLEMDENEKLLAFWRDTSTRHSGAVIPQLHLAMAHERQGDLEQARHAYQQTLMLDADNMEALCRLGALRIMNGDHQGGGELLERAVALIGQDNRHPASAAFSRAARHYFDAGEFAVAAQYYERAITLDQGDIGNYAYLGQALEFMGNADAALDGYREVIMRAPESPATAARIDAIYLARNEGGQLLNLWKEYAAMHPDAAMPRLHLGFALQRVGATGDAAEAFERALSINPLLEAAKDALLSLNQGTNNVSSNN